ncbi:hypothetical protein [Ornithinibacillus halotolerans]|uniref:Uncharacterized protein n=1 Tax=Ornithinibacillus halotolerans TaxID=1274357 RepID=A0A916RN52_9BACI|nr:hypothetical protein [Ornithinibacillus halotolerans]GGA60391.1 hypothetical protein GCM10008025_00500 [Ornithinibacillus halotolerans]
MKRVMLKFFVFFLFLFTVSLIINQIFKGSLEVLTAFSTTFGFSLGYVLIGVLIEKRKN